MSKEAFIAEAAKKRFASDQSEQQRKRVYDSVARGRPLEAEPDPDRRVNRVRAATGLPRPAAEMLAEYRLDASALPDTRGKNAAEAIQGNTTDFLDVMFLEVARQAARAVARIIFRDGRPQGTGFLISDRLLITNNHVMESPRAAQDFLAEFNYEIDMVRRPCSVTRFELAPEIFFETDDTDDLDYTVVAVGPRVEGDGQLVQFGSLPLFATMDRHTLGEFVNIIQHPNGEHKKICLHENRLVARLGKVMHYITDTLPGSSGSPVLNLQCEVVALHHWGAPHRQVQYPDGRAVSQYANEGVRISAIAEELRERMRNMTPDRRALLAAGLGEAETERGRTAAVVSRAAPVSEGGPRLESDGTLHWSTSVPVHVWARVGDGAAVPQPAVAPAVDSVPAPADGEKVAIDKNYSNRSGYKPAFLSGFVVPLPKLSDRQLETAAKNKKARTGDNPHELKYQHFSIFMNSKRRMAFFTACNIDGATWVDIDRKSGAPRESAEAREPWFAEGRIEDQEQCNDRDHYLNQSFRAFDRGHLVRRQDPAWGTAKRAIRANADTFHFSNCVPQHFQFNQQARFWQGIENYILDNAKAEREKVVVFTGPVFDENDPPYRDIRVPRIFWKILVRVDDGQLLATALKADQSEMIETMPERAEDFADIPGRIREFQTSVRDIEQLTGLDFGVLREHDTFTDDGSERIAGGRPLEDFDSLQLDAPARPTRAGRRSEKKESL